MRHPFLQEVFACLAGMLVGAAAAWFVFGNDTGDFPATTHPVADPYDTEYHVHADFLIYIEDEPVDLSADRYMTTNQQELHTDAHLHDNEGDVKHIHAEGVTFAEFLTALGLDTTDECITTPEGEQRCENDGNVLQLYVNGEVTSPLTEYVPVDDDRMLLYYGSPDNPNIESYLDAIPSDSCYYSGTCPERGVAPPESCGLTCDL